MMKVKYFLFIIIILFSSCFGLRIRGTKSPKQVYEVFFIDDGVLQYFIKPLKFKNKHDYFTVDFTFRDTLKYDSFVTTNYSIYTKVAAKKIDSLFFITSEYKIKCKNNDKMFIDLKKKTYQIRYSSGITYQELIYLTSADDYYVLAYYNNSKHKFFPKRKTKKYIDIVNQQVINVIELNKE